MDIVAHRGASNLAPENTLASISRAIELGARWVEVDVRTTVDGRLILMHDADVSRTTDGQGAVSSMSFREIRRLDAGGWFSEKYKGERVPTLDEALKLTKSRAGMCIEIKDADPAEVLSCVQEVRPLDDIWFFDFNHERIKTLLGADSHLKLLALISRPDQCEELSPEEFQGAGIPFSLMSKALLDDLRQRGIKTFVWTVDRPEDMKTVEQLGADFLITNKPELALSLFPR